MMPGTRSTSPESINLARTYLAAASASLGDEAVPPGVGVGVGVDVGGGYSWMLK